MTIREQAEYHRLLLAMGLVRGEDVIAWADGLILRGDAPVEVIDVSLAMNASNHDLDGVLRAVRGDGDLTAAAHAALSRLRPRLPELLLKDAVEKVVRYGSTACVPELEHHDAMLFDVLYEEMVEGYCGSEADLRRMLQDCVNRHAAEPAPGGRAGARDAAAG